MDRLHKIHLIEWKVIWWVHMVEVETCEEINNLSSRQCMARFVETHVHASKKKAKQRWAIEKSKLDNARQLGEIFFIEPNVEEFKLTMKAARRKLEVLMPAAMPCRIPIKSSGKTYRNIGKRKTKYACFVDADESTRPRLEGAGHKLHHDHITAKGTKSMAHYSLVHKFIPTPQAMKIPGAKAVVEKEWEKLEKIPAWQLTKVRKKKDVIDEARNKGRKVHFASLMDLCHLKNSELEPQCQKYKERVVLRGDIVKNDSGSYAVFTEQGSSTSQMTTAQVMDIIPRLSWCSGQSCRRSIRFYSGQNGRCINVTKNVQVRCPYFSIRPPKHIWPKSWCSMDDSVVLLEKNLYAHPLAGLLWERQLEKVINCECLLVDRVRVLFLPVYVDDVKTCRRFSISLRENWSHDVIQLSDHSFEIQRTSSKRRSIVWQLISSMKCFRRRLRNKNMASHECPTPRRT